MMKRLGDYIRPVDVRNRDLKVTRLMGINIEKRFMPSVANVVGSDLSAYKVVTKGQFAYGPVTSRNGDKISVTLLDEFDDAIISQAYTVFEVVDTNALDPEYLMLWFRRPEFDRYARFHSHGSAREVFDWEELCEIPADMMDYLISFAKNVQVQLGRDNLKGCIMERIDELKPLYDSLLSRFTNEEWNCYCTFFIQKGKEFDFSKNRILFIGKSVNGWVSSSKSVDELFSQSNPDRIVNRDDEIEWVQNCAGCAKGYNSRRSAFWRIIIGVINRIISVRRKFSKRLDPRIYAV